MSPRLSLFPHTLFWKLKESCPRSEADDLAEHRSVCCSFWIILFRIFFNHQHPNSEGTNRESIAICPVLHSNMQVRGYDLTADLLEIIYLETDQGLNLGPCLVCMISLPEGTSSQSDISQSILWINIKQDSELWPTPSPITIHPDPWQYLTTKGQRAEVKNIIMQTALWPVLILRGGGGGSDKEHHKRCCTEHVLPRIRLLLLTQRKQSSHRGPSF